MGSAGDIVLVLTGIAALRDSVAGQHDATSGLGDGEHVRQRHLARLITKQHIHRLSELQSVPVPEQVSLPGHGEHSLCGFRSDRRSIRHPRFHHLYGDLGAGGPPHRQV
jgi:hypothetical protein